ncbi:hypothetical protein [Halogeometricum borinquense]|uniref:hypothetical protein n=1 Tax=Halogeometricum borinquense TaxID=60847 RepID=UPI00343ED04F
MTDSESFGEAEYLGWQLLVQLKRRSDEQIPRSKFVKLLCITDREIEQKYDYDIGTPRYWYMYGELVDEHEYTGKFYNAPSAIGWEGQQYLPKRSLTEDDFEVGQEAKEYIDTQSESVVHRFGGKNVEEIKEYQYEQYAPCPFIQNYSELRWYLKVSGIDREQTGIHDFGVDVTPPSKVVEEYLDLMLETFPSEYEEMKSLYLRWDDTVRMMLEQDPDLGEVQEFLDEFIITLSQKELRFQHNSHINEETLQSWTESASQQEREFRESVRAKRDNLLSNRSPSPALDSVSEDFSSSVMSEMNEMLTKDR